MNPAKVRRDRLGKLTDLPNIGPSMAGDLRMIGIQTAEQLRGRDAVELYETLSRVSGQRQDPCVLDVFISITRFMDGEAPKAWWKYTAERKRMLSGK